jgi:NAD(P)-dependent dehydrogenase (short-subunit alcohol dehydrogenase family)
MSVSDKRGILIYCRTGIIQGEKHLPTKLILQGKKVVITGASRGIGLAVARGFSMHGACVMGCSRSCVSQPFPAMHGNDVLYFQADVGQPDDVVRLAQELKNSWGHIDVLVNSAGLLGSMVSLIQYPIENWEAVIRTNLTGCFLMTKYLVPLMSAGASIINISSGYGVHGRARGGAYGVSKFAVEGFSQILAEDLFESGIRVNVVDPGPTRTSMRAAVAPEEDPTTIPHPDDLLPVFLFLASDLSFGITKHRFEAQHFLKTHHAGL